MTRLPLAFLLLGFTALAADPAPPLTLDKIASFDQIEIRGQEVWVGTAGQMAELGTLETIPKGTPLYHWAEPKDIDRWVAHGKVDPGEVDFLDHGANQMVGGGFYASLDPVDSVGFGRKLMIVRAPMDIPLVKTLTHRRIGDEKWAAITSLLQSKGITGMHYTETWLKVTEAKYLTQLKSGSTEALYDGLATRKTPVTIQELLQVDARYPLTPSPWLTQNQPVMAKLVDGKKLTPAEIDEFWKAGAEGAMQALTQSAYEPSRLSKTMLAQFRPQILETLKTGIASGADIMNFKPGAVAFFGMDDLFRKAIGMGFAPEEIAPELKDRIPRYRPAPNTAVQPRAVKLGDFGDQLSQSTNFMTIEDLAHAAATNDPAPWAKYDVPGAKPVRDRWIDSWQAQKVDEVYRKFAADPNVGYRDTESKSDWIQVTDAELKRLEANPLIDVEKDPRGLVRIVHPSAANFEKFKADLSPALFDELTQARTAGKLADTAGADFRALTKRLVEEITLKHQAGFGLKTYTALAAVDPLSHGPMSESALKLAAKCAGNPITLPSPLDALRLSDAELGATIAIRERQLQVVQQAMVAEAAKNPAFPRYYDMPELWQFLTDTPQTGPDGAAFVTRQRAALLQAGAGRADCALAMIRKALGR